MNFEHYQHQAHKTADYQSNFYPWWGLMEEATEVSKLVGKQWLRGDNKSEPSRNEIIAELGDVLWMLSEIATQQDISLREVAQYNLKKLADRANRGVIKGDGDNR